MNLYPVGKSPGQHDCLGKFVSSYWSVHIFVYHREQAANEMEEEIVGDRWKDLAGIYIYVSFPVS